MQFRFTFVIIVLISVSQQLCAQEICNNGIDDDGDLWIDFADCECDTLSASKRGNIWHFGDGLAIDFNSGSPVPISGSAMTAFEGSACISDENGNLLFYTNGGGRTANNMQDVGTIWNRNNQVMYEMNGVEGGGFSAMQSSIIIPKPNQPNTYYLFTMEEIEFNIGGSVTGQPAGRGFSFFEIDMSLNGGLGGVTVADQRIHVPAYEALTAIQHDNGIDFWILIQDASEDFQRFLVYLVDDAGIQFIKTHNYQNYERANWIKGSPARNKIATPSDDALVIFDFNATNGEITNPAEYFWPFFTYGEFSPSGEYFYGLRNNPGGPGSVVQRLEVNGSNPSLEIISTESIQGIFTGQFQVAPDGNILFRNGGGRIGAVLCPDSPCPFVEQNFIELQGDPGNPFFGTTLGFPNFPNHYFYQLPDEPLEILSPDTFEICPGEEIEIFVETNQCASFQWISGETASRISVNAPGIYEVMIGDACCPVSHTIEVIEVNSPTVLTNVLDSVCVNNDVTFFVENARDDWLVEWLTANGNFISQDTLFGFIESDTLFNLRVTSACGVFTTPYPIGIRTRPRFILNEIDATCDNQDGAAIITNAWVDWDIRWTDVTGAEIGRGPEIQNLATGQYTVFVNDTSVLELGCTSQQTFDIISFPAPPTVSAEPAFCDLPTGQIRLDGLNTSAAVFLGGELITINPISNLTPGAYDLSVVDNGCQTLDTLIFIENEIGDFLIGDTTIITSSEIPLNFNLPFNASDFSIEWTPAQFLSCSNCPNPQITAQQSISYNVMFIDTSNGCSGNYQLNIFMLEDDVIYAPNVFTPNSDGANDEFQIYTPQGAMITRLDIFSRWGEQVFSSEQGGLIWDGRFRGEELPSGVFTYLVQVTFPSGQVKLEGGDILLIR